MNRGIIAAAMRRTLVLSLAILLAMMGLGAIRWLRAPRSGTPQSFVSLDRRIAAIDLRSIPARHAFAQLQAVAGVRIETAWDSMEAHDGEPDHPVWLNANNVTVEQ